MYVVQFNAARVIEFTDPAAFDRRVRRWLSMREGENLYLWGMLPGFVALGPQPGLKFFTIEENGIILAAGMVLPSQTLYLSWATHEHLEVLLNHMCSAGWKISQIHAPGHGAGYLGRNFAERTGQRAVPTHAERVYQLAWNFYALPATGHLEAASEADRPLVREWVEDYLAAPGKEVQGRSLDEVVESLLGPRRLYFWKTPQPVAMAAWGSSTLHGASIHFVYTPPELRGQGYGKAVSAALSAQMLASGLLYCFILTQIDNDAANAMYQGIGARTLCELTRCAILPADTPPPASR